MESNQSLVTGSRTDRLMRPKQIIREKLPIGLSTLWLWVAQGKFPKPTKLSSRVSVWRESLVDSVIADMERQKGGAQ